MVELAQRSGTMYRDVRNPETGRLLFRFDPEQDTIQVKDRGKTITVHLAQWRRRKEDQEKPGELATAR